MLYLSQTCQEPDYPETQQFCIMYNDVLQVVSRSRAEP